MKKKINLIMVALVALGCFATFAGCSETSTSTGTSSGTSTGTSTSTSTGTSTESSSQSTSVITPKSVTYNLRSDTATITDSGRENQKMDIVPFSDNYNASTLYNAGYTKLKVEFSFDVREIDDGYQYVFLYYDTSCKGHSLVDQVVDLIDDSDPSLLYTYKFEHGSGEKDTSWSTHTFSTSVSMASIKDDLYIRYGSSGKYEDDWQNKNVVVTLTPYKGA